MFSSPNKGKNTQHLQQDYHIILSLNPIFGYISSNVVFHLSSLQQSNSYHQAFEVFKLLKQSNVLCTQTPEKKNHLCLKVQF